MTHYDTDQWCVQVSGTIRHDTDHWGVSHGNINKTKTSSPANPIGTKCDQIDN